MLFYFRYNYLREGILISVVIPTRNRPILLLQILGDLDQQTLKPNYVIVVDSSDNFQALNPLCYRFNLIHVKENIPSAANQRNIGMSFANELTTFLCFLDDDVRIQSDYLEQLCRDISDFNLVGVSGIALATSQSLRLKPHGISGLYKRIFMLDSKKSGALLSSGVNVPLHRGCDQLLRVDWLIGCSCWKYEVIKNHNFPKIPGYSLGEDVIFSAAVRSHGKLAVDPEIVLRHSESEIGRPNNYEYWRSWINYRKYLLNYQPRSTVRTFSFWWANIGKAISTIFFLPFFPSENISILRGIFAGIVKSTEFK
jgi:glycosyltransferase involved in cell wall biosynthesis